ncbi:O-succinylbenzoic acid--CoA ligase [Cryobacterium psychrotolerans]|uniref:O-succinylbenzoic acid--CoA ligase n=1 Tax=Cryobacterium psychrotolerans TaxID=386301 RepID=A0A1G9D5I5_9MICO|nr:AMP-binding protein [Cryobacterium psychrotolerans]SDK59179.1 O-succinylbenzoic acid--CoA ligase [Cryobacterium psychrotolerans]
MTRALIVVPADNTTRLLALLRSALTGEGDAVMPVPGSAGARPSGTVPRRVAVVIETSGSTGAPKRVMLSTDALLAGAAASNVALGGPGQWLLALPGHYIAGVQVLVRSIAAQTTPLVLPPGGFDPAAFIRLAGRLGEPLRFTSLVPVQLARLMDAAALDRPSLAVLRRFTAILVGGQAVPPELLRRAAELDLRVVRSYGSSETAGGCVYDGVPIGDTMVRVVDGQLEITGAVLAEGYLGDAALTAERFVSEHGVRWYRTGDLGSVDARTGLVRVFGRADNVIISGGEKVSLDAVERVVRTLPGLAEAVVLDADDAEWGQVPVVVLAAASDGPVRPAELAQIREAAASLLGKAARPARVVAVPAIPVLASGKPDRQALRRLLASAPGSPAQ